MFFPPTPGPGKNQYQAQQTTGKFNQTFPRPAEIRKLLCHAGLSRQPLFILGFLNFQELRCSWVLKTLPHHVGTDAGRSQFFDDMVGQPISLILIPASENVQNQVTEFRPGMEGNVRLGQKGEPRDPVGLELMEPGPEIGKPGFFYRTLDEIVEISTGIDLFRIAAI
jgi:hypothetical protein